MTHAIRWNQEQAEEVLHRFEILIAEFLKDPTYSWGVLLSEDGTYVPFVSLKKYLRGEETVPFRYVAVIKQGDNAYRILFKNMFILLGVGIPVNQWRHQVPGEKLCQVLSIIWNKWFALFPEDNIEPLSDAPKDIA